MRSALGPTVAVIRQQLSPQERALWFEHAHRKLSGLQEAAGRAARRGKNYDGKSDHELIREYQEMSEQEQAAWRGNILQHAARLFRRSSANPHRLTPRLWT